MLKVRAYALNIKGSLHKVILKELSKFYEVHNCEVIQADITPSN